MLAACSRPGSAGLTTRRQRRVRPSTTAGVPCYSSAVSLCWQSPRAPFRNDALSESVKKKPEVVCTMVLAVDTPAAAL